MLDINYSRVLPREDRRTKPFMPNCPLAFASVRADHLFLMDWHGELTRNGFRGEWKNPRIVPYNPTLMPREDLEVALGAGDYGQNAWEGAKFVKIDGELYSYRLDKNAARINQSARISLMPEFPQNDFMQAAHTLADIDRAWYPEQEGACLYLRPKIAGIEDHTGVRPATKYRISMFLSASGPYYREGFNETINLLIQKIFHRAVKGGIGAGKIAGDYVGSLRAQILAKILNAHQVLYLDSSNQCLEEAGTSAVGYVQGSTITLPPNYDTILPSITVQSIEDLSRMGILDIPVERRQLTLDELLNGLRDETDSSRITDVMGLGTAAIVAPVGNLHLLREEKLDPEMIRRVTLGLGLNVWDMIPKGREREFYDVIKVDNGEIGEITRRVYEIYSGILNGRIEAPEGWLQLVERRFED